MGEKDINKREEGCDDVQQAEKMRIIGRLAGGIAHDFNNILTAIIGNAEMAEEEFVDFSQIQNSIDKVKIDIHEKVDQLDKINEIQLVLKELHNNLLNYNQGILKAGYKAAELTNQLLVYSRKQKLKFEKMIVNEEIMGMYTIFRRLIPENIQINFQTESKNKTINGDKAQFMQVILNLVSNASAAMPNGGNLYINTAYINFDEESVKKNSNARIGQFVQVSVKDDGEGIHESNLKKIFEPFYTTKEQGQGTGLGLAVMQSIVEQHDGWIDVETELGQGTRFDVYFPYVEDDKSVIKMKKKDKIEVLSSQYTILVIEDNSDLMIILQTLLTRNKCTLHIAENVQQGYEIYQKYGKEIDLVFSDHITPGEMTGVQLIEKITKISSQQKMLLTSGYIDPNIEKDIEKTDTPFIQKPYSPNRLIKKMKEILGE